MSIIARTRPAVKFEALTPHCDESREPYNQDDLDWAAENLNADCTDYDVAGDDELEWPGSREEYECWLDSIAPLPDELEHRNRCDAFLGHDA